jgi:hypothetical protein
MPKWKNNHASKVIVVGSERIQPGDTVETLGYYDPIVTGATKIADAPFYNPIVASGRITATGEILIPTKDAQGNYVSRYQIHMYCGAGGYATITLNDAANLPALVLASGRAWNMRCMERMYEKIQVTLTGASEFFYTIELA